MPEGEACVEPSARLVRPSRAPVITAVGGNEELLDGDHRSDDALLAKISHQRFQRRAVRLDAVGPGIAPEYLIDLIEIGGHPRQHIWQGAQIAPARARPLLAGAHGVEQAARNEGIVLIDVAAQCNEMHDRKYPRSLVVVFLHLAIIRKQPPDIGIVMNGIRQGGAHNGIDAAALEQIAQRLAGCVLLDRERQQERQRARMAMRAGLIDGAFDPVNPAELDAVIVLQMAAHPHRGAHGIERHADALACQVFWRCDAGTAVDAEHSVAEHAGREDRQCDQRGATCGFAGNEFRARHFRNIELQARHPIEGLARAGGAVHGDEIELNAVGADIAPIKIEHAVVKTARHGQTKFLQHGQRSLYDYTYAVTEAARPTATSRCWSSLMRTSTTPMVRPILTIVAMAMSSLPPAS